MLEVVNNYYSDANDLQNVYGRIAGIPAINNVPMINNIISGYIFDFSAHPYRNFQIYFHLNETYKIFIRIRNDQGFSNWQQVYPDYINKIFQDNGYIQFTNGLTIQWKKQQIKLADFIYNEPPYKTYHCTYSTVINSNILFCTTSGDGSSSHVKYPPYQIVKSNDHEWRMIIDEDIFANWKDYYTNTIAFTCIWYAVGYVS